MSQGWVNMEILSVCAAPQRLAAGKTLVQTTDVNISDESPFSRILLSLAAKLRLPLTSFIQDDINTFYYMNGELQRTYAVENNPDVLRYNVTDNEKGKSAARLFSDALGKVGPPLTESSSAPGSGRLPLLA